MTTTDTPSATTAPGADYEATIRVQADPDALFDALTTVEGLAAWWSAVTGSGERGGELRFTMNATEPVVMHVDEAVRASSVRWTCTSCDFLPDWVGTRPTFTLARVDDGATELRFHHIGLSSELECIEMCARGWDRYLPSLRDYVESGKGRPLGSPEDAVQREREAAGTKA